MSATDVENTGGSPMTITEWEALKLPMDGPSWWADRPPLRPGDKWAADLGDGNIVIVKVIDKTDSE